MLDIKARLKRLVAGPDRQAAPCPGTEQVLDGHSALGMTEALVARAASGTGGHRCWEIWRSGAGRGAQAGCPREALGAAMGMSLAGLRASAFIDGSLDLGLLRSVVHQRLPLVVHLAAGSQDFHDAAATGAVVLVPCCLQEAVDLAVVARRLAEQALLPVVVCTGRGLLESLQEVRLPQVEQVAALLGEPQETVECPTAGQRLLYGARRRRVPSRHDLDWPGLCSPGYGPEHAPLPSAGQLPYAQQPLADLLGAAFGTVAQHTGRQLHAVTAEGLDGSALVLLTTGSAVETARATASRLSSPRVGVVAVRCLHPFPSDDLAGRLKGRTVAVLEPTVAPTGQPPLIHALAGGLESSRLCSVAWGVAGQPRRARDLAALCRGLVDKPRPFTLLGMRFVAPGETSPHRQALRDQVVAEFPQLAEQALVCDGPPLDVRPEGSLTLRLCRGGELLEPLARALQGGLGGAVRAAGDRIVQGPSGLLDSGSDGPVDLLVVVGRQQVPAAELAAAGAVVLVGGACGVAGDQPVFRVAPDASREGVLGAVLGSLPALGRSDRQARHFAAALWPDLPVPEDFQAGFEQVARVTPARQVETPASRPGLPQAVRRLNPSAPPLANVPAFYHQVIQASQPTADPISTSGVVPALTSSFRAVHPGAWLPELCSSRCTGCGACWSACPQGALAPLALAPRELIEAGLKLASDAGRQVSGVRRLASGMASALAGLEAPENAGTALREAYRRAADQKGLDGPRRAEADEAIGAVCSQLDGLPLARPACYGQNLLSVVIQPDACQSCGLCLAACPAEALVKAGESSQRRQQLRAQYGVWERLPDTAGDTIARLGQQPEVGRMAATLLSRHASAVMSPGMCEPGSGNRLALRLCLAAAEASLQPRLADQLQALGRLRQSLPDEAELAALEESLRRGGQGLGRARLGLVLDSCLAQEIAPYPFNPFQVPVTVAEPGTAAGLVVGLCEGQLAHACDGIAAMRRARHRLESPKPNAPPPATPRWDNLSADERRWCPPTLLVTSEATLAAQGLAWLSACRLPITVLVLADPLVQDTAMAALFARDLYVLQSSIAYPDHLQAGLSEALACGGPALVRLAAPCADRDGFAPEELLSQAQAAVESRAVPLWGYDPRRPGAFGARLDLAGNPQESALSPLDWARTQARLAARGEQSLQTWARDRREAWHILGELASADSQAVEARVREQLACAHRQELEATEQDHKARVSELRTAVEQELRQNLRRSLVALVEDPS